MNSCLTSERVYSALKHRLLSGEFKPGERLDPALLSDTLSSSVTPVRDVLNILRGEGLVETRTGEGFFRPHLTVPDLEDLYGWEEQILHLAVRQARDETGAAPATADADVAEHTAILFQAMANRSPNAEHGKAIAGLNDRLHAVRIVEMSMLADPAEEILEIERAWHDRREIARLLTAYHRRRQKASSEIVRAIYRGA